MSARLQPGVAEFLADYEALGPSERRAAVAQVKSLAANLATNADLEAVAREDRLVGRVQSLGQLARDGVPPVEYLPGSLAERVVYAAGVTVLSGHPGSGKTTIAQHLAIEAMREGVHVVYLDFESGERDAVSRLLALGATPDLLDAKLHYLAFPTLDEWDQVAELWKEWPGALGVWDSFKGALNTLGLDEDRAKDVQRFTQPLLELAKGATPSPHLVIDHVTKAEDGRGRYASRGSGVKLADAEGVWYVEASTPFSQSEVGRVTMTRKRQRGGALRPAVYLEVGDGNGGLPIRELDAGEAPTRGARIRDEITNLLRRRDGDRLTKSEIRDEVKGENTQVDRELEALATDSSSAVRAGKDEEGRHTRRYWLDMAADIGAVDGLAGDPEAVSF